MAKSESKEPSSGFRTGSLYREPRGFDPHAPLIGATVNYYIPGINERQTDFLTLDGQWHTTRNGEPKTWTSAGVLFDSTHPSHEPFRQGRQRR